jgi:glutamate-1-semialdehyde 2,1-aminomutase
MSFSRIGKSACGDMLSIEIKDIDRRIWEEELAQFVPHKIYDAHTHIYLSEHDLTGQAANPPASPDVHDGGITQQISAIDRETLDQLYALLFPGREVHNVLFGWVFEYVDFDAINQFVSEQAAQDPLSAPFMLTPPSFSPQHLAEQVDTYGFVGLKPYLLWTNNRWNANITDIIPEPLLEVANDKQLIITLHVSKRSAIADEENIKELIYLSGKYPKVRWILAHCARSFKVWASLEKAIERIKDLPNLWYDFSSVTDTDVYSLIFSKVPLDRLLYGGDIPSDLVRGQMVGFGFGWALLTEEMIKDMNIVHCDPRSTFVFYETLRAARRAMLREGFSRGQIEDIFYYNAVRLLNLPRGQDI